MKENTEYTSNDGDYEEFWNKLMTASSTNFFFNEGKNLQFLVTELSLAASADNRTDRENAHRDNIKVSQISDAQRSTENLDIFYARLATICETEEEKVRATLDEKIRPLYKELKQELSDTRILGQGKTNFEKIGTVFSNIGKVIYNSAHTIGLAFTSQLKYHKNPARMLSATGRLKGELKDKLKPILQKEEMAVDRSFLGKLAAKAHNLISSEKVDVDRVIKPVSQVNLSKRAKDEGLVRGGK